MNLLFDGNYFFYKTLFAFGGYANTKSKKLLDTKKDQEMFVRKVATDVSHAIRNFDNPSRVVFTIDSRSWRKDIDIVDGGYKSTREKSDTINWDAFYAAIADFSEVISKKGFIIAQQEGAECDDLTYLWAERLLAEGEDSVIISGDGDSSQCVRFNDKNFIVAFNPNSKNRKLTAPIGFSKWIAARSLVYDLFDASTYIGTNHDVINSLIAKIPIEEINPTYASFEKIVIGDKGDAVPSIHTWEKINEKTKKTTTYKITAAKAQLMFEVAPKLDNWLTMHELSDFFVSEIEKHYNVKLAPEELQEKIKRNVKLVYLNKAVLPETIVDNFNKHYDKNNGTRPNINAFDVSTLLSDSRFLQESKSFESDFFSNFK